MSEVMLPKQAKELKEAAQDAVKAGAEFEAMMASGTAGEMPEPLIKLLALATSYLPLIARDYLARLESTEDSLALLPAAQRNYDAGLQAGIDKVIAAVAREESVCRSCLGTTSRLDCGASTKHGGCGGTGREADRLRRLLGRTS